MAKKKGVGSSKNGRDSKSKRLGVKIYGNQPCTSGAIIIRQKGNKYRAGESVGTGKDFTLFALKDGVVSYREKKVKKFNGRTYKVTFVEVS